MPKLKTIIVGHTTSNEAGANSPADFTLEFVKKTGSPPRKQSFEENLLKHPSQTDRQKERERGQLDLYRFDVSGDRVNSDDPGFKMIMRINSPDAWLPQSIFVLGHTEAGGIVLLGYHPQWGSDTSQNPEKSQWFDKVGPDDPVGPESHVISS
jgi:hypothetical protein